jgi:uncharacterized membrane-anchored protein YjiN (DUF445 family)
MEFTTGYNSITFEYLYKNVVISIADYLKGDGTPDGKISVLIRKNGEDLSEKSVEMIAAHIQNRMIRGIATACNNVIEINIGRDEQFMYLLHNAIDVVLPS